MQMLVNNKHIKKRGADEKRRSIPENLCCLPRTTNFFSEPLSQQKLAHVLPLNQSQSKPNSPPPPKKNSKHQKEEKEQLGVHYARRYSRKPPNLGRRKKYTLLENMCLRGLYPHQSPMGNQWKIYSAGAVNIDESRSNFAFSLHRNLPEKHISRNVLYQYVKPWALFTCGTTVHWQPRRNVEKRNEKEKDRCKI